MTGSGKWKIEIALGVLGGQQKSVLSKQRCWPKTARKERPSAGAAAADGMSISAKAEAHRTPIRGQ